MTTSLRRLSSFVLGGALLASALAGCATAAGGSPVPESTAVPSADASYAPQAAWLDASSIAVKTWSDACAPHIGDFITGDQSIEIVLVDDEDAVCASVQTAHGTYVGLPAGLDSSVPVDLIVTEANGNRSELTLPGLAEGQLQPADRMSEMVPAATWITDSELAVLTWGSSTCMPGSGDFQALDATQGVVTLHSHTDTVCTMDLVPQITFVSAAGVQADATLVLADHVDAVGQPIILQVAR
ncbi:hypothetical protein [Microbacterium oxydans]|uniref:Lipoprotein n=1 Tax=Microbacterium oxydans TaxID=82380 RepID=A0A0F0L5I7_9MICO|nr:hypothetical protein [Microbacterium oxydans]KJL27590.1 hypothetical protein RS83_02639 [Microbacterium oxydans]